MRAGKGLGVWLFRSPDDLAAGVDGPGFEAPVDGITLVQEYIEAPSPHITRAEPRLDVSGMSALACYLGWELAARGRRAAA